MITLTEEQKQALKETPIANARLYVDKKVATEELLSSICNFGFGSLFDLYSVDFKQLSKTEYKSFPGKKTLALQKLFREMSPQVFDDIVFWNKKYVFPTNYDAKRSLVENLQLVSDELYWYVSECKKRENQIRLPKDQKKISNLEVALRECYYEDKPLLDIANKLGFDSSERVRQFLKLELLLPLFNGEQVEKGKEVLGNISIHPALIKQTREYVENIMFSIGTPLPNRLCQDILNIDVIDIAYGFNKTIIVPAREKGVYESLITPFFEVMTAALKPVRIETIIERISEHEKTYKNILSKAKSYDNEFIYALLYCDELTESNEGGVLLRYEFIKTKNGSILQERALARVLADAGEPLTLEDVGQEYISRYGTGSMKPNLTVTEKFGCRPLASGRKYWVYGGEKPSVKEWIETFSQEKKIFYFDEIFKAVVCAEYIIPEKTLRTYITNICAVDNADNNHFCHKQYVDDYPDCSWRSPIRYGIINWVANEIRQLFELEGVDELHISKVNDWLYNRSQNSDYSIEKVYDHAKIIQNSCLTSDVDSPFVIVSKERGDWVLKKNSVVYNTIEWRTFGYKGRGYEQKLLALATKYLRQAPYLKMYLTDLVSKIVEDNEVENLTPSQIRKKLITFINESKLPHSLKLRSTDTHRRLLEVSIDATKARPIKNKEFDWAILKPKLARELAFCSNWIAGERLSRSYEAALDSFVTIIQNSVNKNLNKILPQRLYEFFFESQSTDDDRYIIMCSISRIFEAMLEEIHYSNGGPKIEYKKGIQDLAGQCGFYAFERVLHPSTNIKYLRFGSYEKTLKYLQNVRNEDSHGKWYIDTYRGDPRPEADKNVDKIKKFAALYIFAVAKYLN